MAKQWNVEEVLQLGRSFQPMCILAAAADLDLFAVMGGQQLTAQQVAARVQGDLRSTTILLDAMAALDLLDKQQDRYGVPPSVARLLTDRSPGNVLAMTQHQANCLRRWTELAQVVKTGKPAERRPSIRGEGADYAAFVEAMDNLSAPVADKLIGELAPLDFRHVLDIGGASGTWTLAFLRRNPKATATIFDLPHVIPQAQARITAAGMAGRIQLVGGDYNTDDLPRGADLAWISAIVHSLSREQNRKLFRRTFQSLEPGGQVLLRDILMERSRTAPVSGALFAVNMLVGTEGGGTFTFAELREDLESAGFTNAQIIRPDEWMNAIVRARKAG